MTYEEALIEKAIREEDAEALNTILAEELKRLGFTNPPPTKIVFY